ncbi:MAG: glycosyltransferase family 4 protein [Prolixibacteraceae bacterium]|nr:glycosyltransferase family 4 protein [Prolixibacteraceae bacterium]MBT6004570.1 glycosyltransferase family 4 protein [Prolixibacteraceae bacterium]MBT6767125.1 glycosyltransferase family 4 protein [Prolixibacteraceae bacterium]MBT7000533.1 glycosyltransferase family 4 protein [Prolixibacteraceae bacterium]MBT7393481.1 glycosyltransferase family 4 protein [Prolixibacteraceae bacterium]
MVKKVLIITYYWPPSGGAGVQRWVKFAKYLSKMNVETFVLTVDPKFATYPQIDESLLKDIPESVRVYYTKSFELYSVYKKFSPNKEVPYGGFANSKKANFMEKILRFVRGNFFLPDPRRGWNKFAVKKAREIIRNNNIETIITTSPPHSTQLIGLKLKKQLNIKWLADFRDPWTDIYYYKQLYPTKLATAINKNFERKVLQNSNKTITVSRELKRLFSSKLNNVRDKTEVIPNGFDIDDFLNINKAKRNNLFYISYVGTISNDYNIDGLINGIKQLSGIIKTKIRLRFIGKISSELVEKLNDTGLKGQIEIVGYVEHSKAISYMMSSDVLLLIIPNVKNNMGILTGKLFEYLASKRPILFLGPVNGNAAAIIEETKSGIICSCNDKDKIAESIEIFFHSTKTDSDFSEALKYSRDNLTKNLLELI